MFVSACLACGILWGVILLAWVIPSLIGRRFYKVYPAIGVGSMLTILLLLVLRWGWGSILWLRYAGIALFVPAGLLLLLSLVGVISLRIGHGSSGLRLDRGVFALVRHPMFLGTALWSVSLVLVAQTLISVFIGLISVAFLWMASVKEEVSLREFGSIYEDYAQEVPRWNLFKGVYRALARSKRK